MKQVIVMRTDLNMRKGKMVAQGAHATLGIMIEHRSINANDVQVIVDARMLKWFNTGMKKICVGIDSEQGLLDLYEQARQAGLHVSSVMDAGHTEFHGVPTLTCIAIGPDEDALVNKITGHLKLL